MPSNKANILWIILDNIWRLDFLVLLFWMECIEKRTCFNKSFIWYPIHTLILSKMFGSFSSIQKRHSVESCWFQALYQCRHEMPWKRLSIPHNNMQEKSGLSMCPPHFRGNLGLKWILPQNQCPQNKQVNKPTSVLNNLLEKILSFVNDVWWLCSYRIHSTRA